MALRAFQLALGNGRFNIVIEKFLGKERLKIPINAMRGKIIFSEEDLIANSNYTGDACFRPGDLVIVSNWRPEAHNTQWLVENGICVGWKGAEKGKPQYDEPLFLGGGLGNQSKTESEIREVVYSKTPNKLKIKGDRKMHFSDKAVKGNICNHTLDTSAQAGSNTSKLVPDIFMSSVVMRINILGGRNDI